MSCILVPFDGSPAGAYALDMACDTAAQHGDEVRAIYVVRIPYQLPISAIMVAGHAQAEQVFEQAQAIAGRYNVFLTTIVAEAREAGPAIVEAARECDCIILGQRPRRRFYQRFVVERILRYVIAHAPCQVLVGYAPAQGRAATATQRFLLTPASLPAPAPGDAYELHNRAAAVAGSGGNVSALRD